MKAKIVAANGLDLRLFRTLPDYYRALPGKLSDTLVAMDRAGASKAELAQAMGGLRGMRLGMLEGNTDEGYISAIFFRPLIKLLSKAASFPSFQMLVFAHILLITH